MCICINCFYLNNCSVYNFVQLKHNSQNQKIGKALINGKINYTNKNFYIKEPKQTLMKIENKCLYFNKYIFLEEIDVNECTNFLELPGNWINNRKERFFY